MPVANAGSTSDANARLGLAQPSFGKPCEGKSPSNPEPRENSRISSRPLHNAGTAPPIMAITWSSPRHLLFLVITAAQPSGNPMSSAMARLSTISGNVTADRTPTCKATDLPLMADTPRSPCSRPVSQSAYCMGNGRSSPISMRSAAIRAAVAFVPAMTAATSPGSTRNARKTSIDNPVSAATNSSSRLATNLISFRLVSFCLGDLP